MKKKEINLIAVGAIVLLIIALIVALGCIFWAFYKLRDHDVQLMTDANNGKITREEALEKMINKKEFVK